MNQRRIGAVLSYVHMAANAVINLLYVPLLLYYIGQDEYGLYKLLASFIAYFGVMDFGLNAAITRFYIRYLALNDHRRISILLGMGAMFYLIIIAIISFAGVLVFFQIDNIFSMALTTNEIIEAHYIFVLLVFNVALSFGSQIYITTIVAHERFVLLKGSALLKVLLQPLLIIFILQYYQNALAVVAAQSLFNLINTVLYVWYAHTKLKVRLTYHGLDREMLKEMRSLAFSVFVVFIVDQIFWQTNQIVIGAYEGTAAVAVYAVASQIYMNYCQFSTIIPGLLGPKITTMVTLKASAEELSEQFIKIGRIQYFILLGLLSAFAIYGRDFIYWWAGESFTDAYWITICIIVPFTIDLVQNLGLTILQAQNRYSFRAIVYCLAGVVNLVLVFMVVKKYGGIGCALTTGLIMFVSNGLIMNYYYSKYIHLQIMRFWGELGKISLAVIPVLVIGWMFELFRINGDYILLGFKLVFYSLAYYLFMYHLAMNYYEREIFSIIKVLKKIQMMR